jgi:hypothetical protein
MAAIAAALEAVMSPSALSDAAAGRPGPTASGGWRRRRGARAFARMNAAHTAEPFAPVRVAHVDGRRLMQYESTSAAAGSRSW